MQMLRTFAALATITNLAGCSAEPTDSVSLANPRGMAAASLAGGGKADLAPDALPPTALAPNHLAQRPPSQPAYSQPLVNPAETDHLPLWPPTSSPSAPATTALPPLFPENPPPLPNDQPSTEQPTATEFAPPAFASPQFAPALPGVDPPAVPAPTAPSDENPLRFGDPPAGPAYVPEPSSPAPQAPAPTAQAGQGNPLRANTFDAPPPMWFPPAPSSPGSAAPAPENLLPHAPAEPPGVARAAPPPGVPLAPMTTEPPLTDPAMTPPPAIATLPKPFPRIATKAAPSRLPRVPINPDAHAEWQAKQKLTEQNFGAADNPSGGSASASDYDPSAYGPPPQPRMLELGKKQDPPPAVTIPFENEPAESTSREGSFSGNGSAAAAIPHAIANDTPALPTFVPPMFEPAAPAAAPSEAAPLNAAPVIVPEIPPFEPEASTAPLLDPPAAAPTTEVAPESSPATPIAQAPASAAPPNSVPLKTSAIIPPANSNDPFDVVRVFYGTDRLPQVVNQDTLWMRLIRFTPAAILIGLSVMCIGVVLDSRKISWIFGTASLLVCSTLAVWHGISETLAIAQLAAQEEPRYSTGRSARGRIERGICEVSIPKTHDPGELEGPSITRLEFEYNPADHVTLRKTVRLQSDAFYEQLREQVASSPNREILVFVHGFNVSFEDAARRTGQMANDLKLQGAPVFFSWPADKYFLLTYGKDETSVSWATPHLKEFLLELVHNTDARAINLVAHSMGNRALTTALREIDLQLRDEARLFNQVVLAAPDIDADDFRDNIAPAIQRTAKQVTLYASKNDIALSASRLLHRNPRAGDTSRGLVLVPGMITIDVSNINGGPWGHSYYGASDPVLRDLHLLLTSLPPERRTWLNIQEQGGQTYWAFKPLHSASAPAMMTPR